MHNVELRWPAPTYLRKWCKNEQDILVVCNEILLGIKNYWEHLKFASKMQQKNPNKFRLKSRHQIPLLHIFNKSAKEIIPINLEYVIFKNHYLKKGRKSNKRGEKATLIPLVHNEGCKKQKKRNRLHKREKVNRQTGI